MANAMVSMNKMSIGVIAIPVLKAGVPPLSDMIDILSPLSTELRLISGDHGCEHFRNDDRIKKICIDHRRGKNTILRMVNFAILQIRVSLAVLKSSKGLDVWILFLSSGLILPVITAKLMRKKVINAIAGSRRLDQIYQRDNMLNIMDYLSRLDFPLYDQIILYSPRLVDAWGLQEWRNAISIAHHHYIKHDEFYEQVNIQDRENIVGYIGRLSEEKGIIRLIEAIGLLNESDTRFMILGDGELNERITQMLRASGLSDRVMMMGWVRNSEINDYLNKMKLLVLPSYTEGLPRIVLEAMASGTPVLSTPVGAVPEIIKDEVNGFLIKDNSPPNIAGNIIRAVHHPRLQEIVSNAHETIERDFTLERAREGYERILSRLHEQGT